MSSLSGDQMVASQRASFETLSDVWAKAFGCIEKLTGLNVRAVKSTLAENQAIASMALSTEDPQELFALQGKRGDWSQNNPAGTVALRLQLRGAEVVVFLRESNRFLLEETGSLSVEQVEESAGRLGKNAG